MHLFRFLQCHINDKHYHHLIKELSLQKKVTFHQEFVPNEEVEKYFKAADVLALPYKQATQSGVAQIAFSMGLGVVVTPVGGLPEIVQNRKTGIVSKTIKPQDIAAALNEFLNLNNKEIYEYTLKEGEKFSWKSYCDLILKMVFAK